MFILLSYNQTMEEAVQRQKVHFLRKSFKIITKENLSKSLKSAFQRLVYKFKRKVETPLQATYELSIEFKTYDEDEEDTYSVVMSLENIEKRVHKDYGDDVETKIVTAEDDVMEELRSFTDLINSFNKLLQQ